MRFETYKKMRDHALAVCDGPLPDVDPHLINPIELAYIGDAVFFPICEKASLARVRSRPSPS